LVRSLAARTARPTECIYINTICINVLDDREPGRHGSSGEEHEDRFYNRTVLAWFHLFDVRAQRVPSFYSHAAAHGGGGTVRRGTLRIAVLRGDFFVADSTRGPVACESLRAFGADDSGGRNCQHTLLSHLHGACGVAAGCGRYGLVVPYDLDGAVRFYRDPSTLKYTGGNSEVEKEQACHTA